MCKIRFAKLSSTIGITNCLSSTPCPLRSRALLSICSHPRLLCFTGQLWRIWVKQICADLILLSAYSIGSFFFLCKADYSDCADRVVLYCGGHSPTWTFYLLWVQLTPVISPRPPLYVPKSANPISSQDREDRTCLIGPNRRSIELHTIFQFANSICNKVPLVTHPVLGWLTVPLFRWR